MKSSRLFIATWALLFILMVSCNREQERIENPVSITIGEVTFNASFGDSQKTKTVIKNDTEIWWSPNDAINVFYGDLTGGKFTATVSQEASSSQFVGSFSAVTGTLETESDNRPFWAVYPYDVLNSCDGNSVNLTVPIKQMGEEGTFAPKIFPAIATSTGLDLAFYNVCGGIVLTITRDDIRAITLTGNNDEIIAGTIRVAFEDGLPAIKEIVAGEKSITFRSPNNKPFIPGTKYFITAIPGIFSQGFKLQFVAANGEEGSWTASQKKAYDDEVAALKEKYAEEVSLEVGKASWSDDQVKRYNEVMTEYNEAAKLAKTASKALTESKEKYTAAKTEFEAAKETYYNRTMVEQNQMLAANAIAENANPIDAQTNSGTPNIVLPGQAESGNANGNEQIINEDENPQTNNNQQLVADGKEQIVNDDGPVVDYGIPIVDAGTDSNSRAS